MVDAFLTAVAAVLPITLVAAAVTFNGIERPFLRWRRAYLVTDPPAPTAHPPAPTAPGVPTAPPAAVVSPR